MSIGPTSPPRRVQRRPATLRMVSTPGEDLDPSLAAEVVSTGLRCLVLPARGDALARTRIRRDVQEPLARLGVQCAHLLDVDATEGRRWHDAGVVEDVATGRRPAA